MKLQDESVALETLAKQVLQYFIDPETGYTAGTQVTATLQTMIDDLNNYYFFTKPYQYISGNSKTADELAAFKENICAVASKDQWSIELAFSTVQKIYEFLNGGDWLSNAVNNKFTVALCVKMQTDLQTAPAISLVELQNLLQGKNGKIFTAELENALGKAIAQNKKLKIDQLTAAKSAMTSINQTYLDDFGLFVYSDQPIFMQGPQTSPILFSPAAAIPIGWFGLRTLAGSVKSTLEAMVEESDDEQEYDAEYHAFTNVLG